MTQIAIRTIPLPTAATLPQDDFGSFHGYGLARISFAAEADGLSAMPTSADSGDGIAALYRAAGGVGLARKS